MELTLKDPKTGFGIRPYRLEDIPDLFQAASESVNEIYPWLPWCHPDYTKEESSTWIHHCLEAWQSGKEHNFVIFELDSGEFAGGGGLNEVDAYHFTANLGYWVRTRFCGKGAASSAARLIAEYGAAHLGYQRMEIIAAVENIASQKAATKAGAHYEGILRNRLNIHGKQHDAAVFSLIPSDFSPTPAQSA